MPSPLTAASEAVGGYTEQVEKNKAAALLLATLRQRQQAEQEKLDIERQNAEATNAYRTQQMAMEQKRFALEQTKSGIDPTTSKPIAPPPAPAAPVQAPQVPSQMQSALGPAEQQQIQDTPSISKTDALKGAAIGLPKEMAGTPLYQQAMDSLQKASELSEQADYYFKAGAIDVGNNLLTRAKEARDGAHQYVLMANELNKDARDFEKFSETVRFHHATEAKWSKEAKQKAAHEKEVLAVMIQRNEITREDALTRYAASLAAIGAADLRHRENFGETHRHNIATEGNAGRTAKLAIERFNAGAANNLQKQQYSATISQWLLSGGTTPMPQPPAPTTVGGGGASPSPQRPAGAIHGKHNGVPGWQHPDGTFHPD